MHWDTRTSWIGCQQCFYIFVVICVCVLNVQGIRIFISNWIETDVSTRSPRPRVDYDPEAYYCQKQTWFMCVYEGGEGQRVVILLTKCLCMCMSRWLGNCSQRWLVTSGKAVAAENGLNSLVETVPATTLMKRAKLRRTWARVQGHDKVLPAASELDGAAEGAPIPDSGHCVCLG